MEEYQVSQLDFYGFKEINQYFIKRSIDLNKDITKVISYFNHEDIEYNLSSEVNRIIQNIHSKAEKQYKVFEKASKIKNGNINSIEFKYFVKFLNSLPRKLKPHQVKAAFHLYSLKNGANFSVPGSGKTTVVLSAYEKLRQERKCNIIFVIGPPSCFQPWQYEFKQTLGREATTCILPGNERSIRISEYLRSEQHISELYLSTFQTLTNDLPYVVKFLNQKNIKSFFVVDEAHYVKQINGSWATALLKISKFPQCKCILTGTPIPRSYKDIFNSFDFLWPHVPPLTEIDKIQINLWEKEKKNEKVKSLLTQKIGPLFYRVRKEDLGLKPAVFHKPTLVKMNQKESWIYEMVKAKIHELSKDDFLRNEEILSKLWKGRMIRLRQLVSYPKLLVTALDGYSENLIETSELIETIKNYDKLELPGKLIQLTKKVQELRKQGQKILIWACFVGTLELIKNHLYSLGLKSEIIYGKTPIRRDEKRTIALGKTREEIRDEFVNKESGLDILIANPAACAESISLHKTCFHAIYYDLSYNCAQYLQSLDRIHRVGGSETNVANYFFLQYENSIDQDIKTNLEFKAKKMYDIIEKDYAIYNLDMFEEDDEDEIAAYRRLFKNSINENK